jgi:hypothetical protein
LFQRTSRMFVHCIPGAVYPYDEINNQTASVFCSLIQPSYVNRLSTATSVVKIPREIQDLHAPAGRDPFPGDFAARTFPRLLSGAEVPPWGTAHLSASRSNLSLGANESWVGKAKFQARQTRWSNECRQLDQTETLSWDKLLEIVNWIHQRYQIPRDDEGREDETSQVSFHTLLSSFIEVLLL